MLSAVHCFDGNGEFCTTNLPVTPHTCSEFISSFHVAVTVRAKKSGILLLLPLLGGRVVFTSSHPSHYVRIRRVYYFAHSSSHPYTLCVVVLLLYFCCLCFLPAQSPKAFALLCNIQHFYCIPVPLSTLYSYSSESDALVNASSLKALNFLFPGYNVHIFEDIFRK